MSKYFISGYFIRDSKCNMCIGDWLGLQPIPSDLGREVVFTFAGNRTQAYAHMDTLCTMQYITLLSVPLIKSHLQKQQKRSTEKKKKHTIKYVSKHQHYTYVREPVIISTSQ